MAFFIGKPRQMAIYNLLCWLHIKLKMHHFAIFHDVIFPVEPHLPCLFDFALPPSVT